MCTRRMLGIEKGVVLEMRAADREAEWLKSMQRVGEFLTLWDRPGGPGLPEGTELEGLSIKFPSGDRTDTLIILKASGDVGRFVGFMGGLTLTQALLTWRAKALKDVVKWREDVPFGER